MQVIIWYVVAGHATTLTPAHAVPWPHQDSTMSGRLGLLVSLSVALMSRLGSQQYHLILVELLPERHGTYVDVGTARPRLGCNTYFHYRRG